MYSNIRTLLCAVLFIQPLAASDLEEINAHLVEHTPIIEATLDEPKNYRFDDTPLEEFVETAKAHGVEMLLAPSVKDKRINLILRHMSFSKALPRVIEAAGAHWIYQDGRVIVFERVSELKPSFADAFDQRKALEFERRQLNAQAKQAEAQRARARARSSSSSSSSNSSRTSRADYLPIEDFHIAVEDGQSIEIIALLEGPNGTPFDLATIEPGPWEMDLSDLPPDSYSLVLDADGYAEQRISLTYKDGRFVARSEDGSHTLTLYKERYITFEVVWNSRQERDLANEDSLRETVCATHHARHPVIGHDFLIIQTLAEPGASRATIASGPNPALRKHRYSSFFGIVYPDGDQDFESARLAPPNDQYKRDGLITLEPDNWFFLRISGHLPEMITYLKMRVISVDLSPPSRVRQLDKKTPRWHRAQDIAQRMGIQLPK